MTFGEMPRENMGGAQGLDGPNLNVYNDNTYEM
jgi:hypothetical protein